MKLATERIKMARPKKNVIVKVFGQTKLIDVWADNLVASEILSIEGVTQILAEKTLPWLIATDPRFDVNEVAAEIEALLSPKVPEAFYDEADSPD